MSVRKWHVQHYIVFNCIFFFFLCIFLLKHVETMPKVLCAASEWLFNNYNSNIKNIKHKMIGFFQCSWIKMWQYINLFWSFIMNVDPSLPIIRMIPTYMYMYVFSQSPEPPPPPPSILEILTKTILPQSGIGNHLFYKNDPFPGLSQRNLPQTNALIDY